MSNLMKKTIIGLTLVIVIAVIMISFKQLYTYKSYVDHEVAKNKANFISGVNGITSEINFENFIHNKEIRVGDLKVLRMYIQWTFNSHQNLKQIASFFKKYEPYGNYANHVMGKSHSSFTRILGDKGVEDEEGYVLILTNDQILYLEELSNFYHDLSQLNIEDKDMKEILMEIDNVAKKYETIRDYSFY